MRVAGNFLRKYVICIDWNSVVLLYGIMVFALVDTGIESLRYGALQPLQE